MREAKSVTEGEPVTPVLSGVKSAPTDGACGGDASLPSWSHKEPIRCAGGVECAVDEGRKLALRDEERGGRVAKVGSVTVQCAAG